MTMNINKKLAARLAAVALVSTTWGAMAATSAVTMTGTVQQASCTLASGSSSVAVDLGTVTTGDFVGQAAGYAVSTAGFNLDLESCDGIDTLRVWASEGDLEPGMTNAIRNSHGEGGATGVATQIFYGNRDNAMNPSSDASGDAIIVDITDNVAPSLPFTAKMVKVGGSGVTPDAGGVKGTVTLNVAYN